MKSYGQFCPIAMALDVLGERWTLLVVRELLCGSSRFNEIMRGVPQMSRTMLAQRLRTLEEARLIEKHEGDGGPRYRVTDAGEELRPVLIGLGTWGQRWARGKLTKELLDPKLLMWDIRRNVDLEALPDSRVVVRFWFRDVPAKVSRYWLCLKRGDADLCLQNPGYDVDLAIQTRARTMTEIWLGDRTFHEAVRSGELELEGPRTLQRNFGSWLKGGMFADVPRVA